MDEGSLGIHQIELVVKTSPGLGNGGGVLAREDVIAAPGLLDLASVDPGHDRAKTVTGGDEDLVPKHHGVGSGDSGTWPSKGETEQLLAGLGVHGDDVQPGGENDLDLSTDAGHCRRRVAGTDIGSFPGDLAVGQGKGDDAGVLLGPPGVDDDQPVNGRTIRGASSATRDPFDATRDGYRALLPGRHRGGNAAHRPHGP